MSFPSSYIKTEASQVTRAADQVSRVLGSEFNASEGTLFTEVYVKTLEGRASLLSSGDTFPGGVFGINRLLNSIRIAFIDYDNQIIVPITDAGFYKVAGSYNSDGTVTAAVDGVSYSASSAPIDISAISSLKMQAVLGGITSVGFDSHFSCYIPRALTESELIALTTPEQ